MNRNKEFEDRIVGFIKDADFQDIPENTIVCFNRTLTSDEIKDLSLYLYDVSLAIPDKYNCLKLSKDQFQKLKELKEKIINLI